MLEDREKRLTALQVAVDTGAQERRQAEALILTLQTCAAGAQESLDAKAADLLQLSVVAEEAQALAEERLRALEIATEQLKAADATLAKTKAGAAGDAGEMRKLLDAGVAEREALQVEVERLTAATQVEVQVRVRLRPTWGQGIARKLFRGDLTALPLTAPPVRAPTRWTRWWPSRRCWWSSWRRGRLPCWPQTSSSPPSSPSWPPPLCWPRSGR